jgi:hypothetical protein
MAFVDRTAYPRLPSAVSVGEIAEVFTPTAEAMTWVCAKVVGPGSRLVLLMLKCYQRLGYFPQIAGVPTEAVEYVWSDSMKIASISAAKRSRR